MKLLAIDYGTKRIGLALGDSESRVAAPWKVLHLKNDETLSIEIAKIVVEEDIGAVVLGEPVLMSGERGSGSAKVKALAHDLAKHIGPIPIHLVDERLSSKLADRMTEETGAERDSQAAAVILESFFDRR